VKGIFVVPALLVVVLAYAVLDEQSGIRTWLRLRDELAASRARIALLREEVAGLRDEADRLESDPFATERAIREVLQRARPGETIVRLEELPTARFP